MRPAEIAAQYRKTIGEISREIVKGAEARIMLDSWERKLKLYAAELLLNGAAEGKNAEERAARLLMASRESTECQSLRASLEQARRKVAEVDARLSVVRETCRLLRLELTLAASPSVLEAVA
jgi:hypothetical protein